MKICLVNDYSLDQIGGAVTSLLEQKNALERAGHDVWLMQLGTSSPNAPNNSIFIKPDVTMSKQFYSLPFIRNSAKRRTEIKSILVDLNIDIIHFQSEMSLAFTVLRVAQELSIPTIHTIHTFFWIYLPRPFRTIIAKGLTAAIETMIGQKLLVEPLPGNAVEQALKNLTLTLAKQSSAVISPSNHMAQSLARTTLMTPVSVIPNPFTPHPSAKKPILINSTPDVIKIVWIGRIESEKRPLEFIQALMLANQTVSNFHVTVVGDGSLSGDMRRLGVDVPNITFVGKQTHEAVITLIDSSDIVAITSYHYDNQPMIIAEAISRYRPVLYCDERLSEGLEHAGVRTANKSIEALSDSIISLVSNPSVMTELSRSAKQSSALFTAETFVQKVTTSYRSITPRKI